MYCVLISSNVTENKNFQEYIIAHKKYANVVCVIYVLMEIHIEIVLLNNRTQIFTF